MSDTYQESKKDSITTVVKICRKLNGPIIQDCDIYIGRQINMGGWNLKGSIFANPFKVGSENISDATTAVYLYWKWLHFQVPDPSGKPKYIPDPKTILKELPRLEGKILGCWCKKKPMDPCHGDVLISLIDQKINPPLSNVLRSFEDTRDLK